MQIAGGRRGDRGDGPARARDVRRAQAGVGRRVGFARWRRNDRDVLAAARSGSDRTNILLCGLAVYQELLQQRPVIFGRRRFGLTPTLPQVLRRLGFAAAVHCTLDDGRFPTSDQSLISWEGLDGTTIESLGSVPIDAGRAELFLSLPKKLADTMSLDRTATVTFAHWPSQVELLV